MSDPKDKSPAQQPTGEPKVDAAEQDVITNTDESNKIVNTDDAVADMDGIETTLSESEPSTALNADRGITNSDDANGDEPVVN
ncbi:hypothetical protein IDJ77_13350 [Mucilaginibacter sp. ZT4R22]|uniref:Uncharacterized protein n=1 Tax=Mucilaginibacter pankratovii TaxID=2772110 RepID=A0ABR7WR59_9SPHI|nr:hypothetical protein [Mucilaginibacter pankratovii]MBD1364801.1 hypothetical protein [Mucilaginibacter pankratovii]